MNKLGENVRDPRDRGSYVSTADDTIDAVGGALSQRAKLIQRICSRPPNARFRDVQQLLEAFGWTMARQRGSHVTFVQGGELPITVPIRAGKVVGSISSTSVRDWASMTSLDVSEKDKTMRPLSFFLEQHYPFSVTPDPDGGYYISFPDLPGCMSQVDEPSEIGPAAEEIRTLWLETAHEQGTDIPLPQGGADYSGKFVVRVPRHLHRRLADSAALDGVSLNQYVVSLLATNDALTRVERHLTETDRRIEGLAAYGSHSREASPKRRRAALSIVASEPQS